MTQDIQTAIESLKRAQEVANSTQYSALQNMINQLRGMVAA